MKGLNEEVFFFSLSSDDACAPENEEQEIRKAVETLIAADNRGDLESMVASYHPAAGCCLPVNPKSEEWNR